MDVDTERLRKTVAVLAAAASVATGVAAATGKAPQGRVRHGHFVPLADATFARVTAAALARVPGRVEGAAARDEGAGYEVQVLARDGSQRRVTLDPSFVVTRVERR